MRGLYLRGKTWWFRFQRDGHQYRVSTNESDEARAIIAARVIQEQPLLVSGEHLYREIDAYCDSLASTNRSARYYDNIRSRLRPWASEIGPERSLAEITQADMQAWFNAKRKTVLDNTAVAYLDDIRRLFKWALEKAKVRSNPCDGLEEPRVRQRHREKWIDKEIAIKLLDECKDLELKYCLFCALHCGMRKDEVIMSRARWFSLERGFVRIPDRDGEWKPKDGCTRTIPLSPKFRAFLTIDYPLREPFMIAPDVAKGDWRYRFDFKTRFNNYVRSQGVEVSFHDLRRSFASILVNEGVSGFLVAEWLGDDIRLVQKVYGHLAPDHAELGRVFG
jgi:integrase